MTNEIKDWRETPIEIGSKVFYHGNGSYATGIGVVTKVTHPGRHPQYGGTIWVDWSEHRGHQNKKSQPLLQENVTVLTKDMFDDA